MSRVLPPFSGLLFFASFLCGEGRTLSKGGLSPNSAIRGGGGGGGRVLGTTNKHWGGGGRERETKIDIAKCLSRVLLTPCVSILSEIFVMIEPSCTRVLPLPRLHSHDLGFCLKFPPSLEKEKVTKENVAGRGDKKKPLLLVWVTLSFRFPAIPFSAVSNGAGGVCSAFLDEGEPPAKFKQSFAILGGKERRGVFGELRDIGTPKARRVRLHFGFRRHLNAPL